MKRKNQEGAIVVEATISLTTFMFLVVTILTIVNICLVQAKMGTLVHGVAKDISNYTYIYTMTGLNEREQVISGKADYARNGLETVKENSTDAFSAIESIGNVAMDSEFWNSMLSLLTEGGIQEGKAIVIDKICKSAAEKRLETAEKSADAFLIGMGIEDGIAGLDFKDSSFCAGGGDDITIVVSYKVHIIKLLGVDFEFNFEQCAATKTWCAASGGDSGASGEDTKNNNEEGSDENESEENDKPEEDEEEPDDPDEPENDESEENNEDEEEKKKTVEEYVSESTHNKSSDYVIIGKNTGDPETDYTSLGDEYNMTYFELDNESENALKESDELWDAYERFLEDQDFKGKTFMLSSNPYNATGTFGRQVEWLESRGYTFEFDPATGMWKAVRK